MPRTVTDEVLLIAVAAGEVMVSAGAGLPGAITISTRTGSGSAMPLRSTALA